MTSPEAAHVNEGDKAEPTYIVPGLERGLKILTEFSPREPVLGAPELSRRLGIPRTTVFRLLQTLESLGFWNARTRTATIAWASPCCGSASSI